MFIGMELFRLDSEVPHPIVVICVNIGSFEIDSSIESFS